MFLYFQQTKSEVWVIFMIANPVRHLASNKNKLLFFSHSSDSTDFTWCKLHWLLTVTYLKKCAYQQLLPSPCLCTTISFKNCKFAFDNWCSTSRNNQLEKNRVGGETPGDILTHTLISVRMSSTWKKFLQPFPKASQETSPQHTQTV